MIARSKAQLMFPSTRSLAVLLVLVGATPCRAETFSPDKARDLVGLGAILPLEAVLARMRPAVDGEIVEVFLEIEDGRFLYRIKALGRDGRYRDTRVDAAAGASANR
jgi:hypothetical protein